MSVSTWISPHFPKDSDNIVATVKKIAGLARTRALNGQKMAPPFKRSFAVSFFECSEIDFGPFIAHGFYLRKRVLASAWEQTQPACPLT